MVLWFAVGYLLTCGRDKTLCFIDTRMSCNVLARLAAPTFLPVVPWAVPALSPCGNYVTAGGSEGTLFVWNLGSTHKDGSGVRITSGNRNEPFLHPSHLLRHENRVPQEQRNAGIVAAAWNPTGAPVVTGDKRGGITFWGHD